MPAPAPSRADRRRPRGGTEPVPPSGEEFLNVWVRQPVAQGAGHMLPRVVPDGPCRELTAGPSEANRVDQALAAWNFATRSAGTRPRAETSMPCDSAQERTSFGL